MSLQCGIVGLPNVGKSTLFNCLTNAKVKQANYPFCTIDPNFGIAKVPDSRLYKLAELVNYKQTVPSVIEFIDIAGLVKGASKGDGLGNQFLGNIRECDAIIHVLRCFENKHIAHVDGEINPIRDKEIVETELLLKDIETTDRWLEKVLKKSKSGNNEDQKFVNLLEKIKNEIEKGCWVSNIKFTNEEYVLLKEIKYLTAKPIMYVCNVDESSAKSGNKFSEEVKKIVQKDSTICLVLAVQTEADLSDLSTNEEKEMFLEELGLKKTGSDNLIKAAYKLLNLKTFFTMGPKKEVRTWTFKKGQTAQQCAGIIHTDFSKGFIRAEVMKYKDFFNHGSENACREAGKISIEGKNYQVKDGDILHIRFNV